MEKVADEGDDLGRPIADDQEEDGDENEEGDDDVGEFVYEEGSQEED